MIRIYLLLTSCGLFNMISAQVLTIRQMPPLQGQFSLQVAPKPPCDARKMREIRSLATGDSSSVTINCSCTLDSGDVITKQLIFEGTEANYVIFDGRGALLEKSDGIVYAGKDMIEVKSSTSFSNGVRTWQRPMHVTIKNLRVTGSIRIWGMTQNGQGLVYTDDGKEVNHYKNSSLKEGHTERARANAPAYITLERITITGTGRNPVYFAPGVSFSKLLNSTLLGYSDAVAVYLDAESTRNTIKDNQFHIESGNHPFERWDRPLIAIDGSSYDTIANNYLSALNHGGIYLYRNCGEGGVIRHSTPSHNLIINNIFPYNKYDGDNPGVYLSSKNDDFTLTGFGFGFCEDDEGYPFGSSASNLDYARYNVVMQNQILKRPVSDVIVTKNPKVNYPNYIKFNRTVTTAVERPCGCYVGSKGFKKDFIEDGKTIEALEVSPEFRSFNYTCRNGTLIKTGENSAVTRHAFDCKATNDNKGCEKVISCPAGQTIIGATAAANLEFGDITDEMMDLVPTNMLQVLKTSDDTDDGLAFLGTLKLSSFEKVIENVDGLHSISIGCKEHDDNGGDCHLRVYLYCRQF